MCRRAKRSTADRDRHDVYAAHWGTDGGNAGVDATYLPELRHAQRYRGLQVFLTVRTAAMPHAHAGVRDRDGPAALSRLAT